MSIVTLTTDFGDSDYYAAALKGQLLSVNPNIKIIDISHAIEKMDIGHGAYVLEKCYADFPDGTVHLIGVDSNGAPDDKYIAMKLNKHFFVGRDNGLLSLIPYDQPPLVVEIQHQKEGVRFPAKNILAHAAAKLASGQDLESLGPMFTDYKQYIQQSIKANKKGITGNVIRVDHYGNIITNIPKLDFDILSADRTFEIVFGRDRINRIHEYFHEVDEGDCFVLFNSSDHLQIGIRNGHASNLLGLKRDHKISILFEE